MAEVGEGLGYMFIEDTHWNNISGLFYQDQKYNNENTRTGTESLKQQHRI